jgi:hypothetical protein
MEAERSSETLYYYHNTRGNRNPADLHLYYAISENIFTVCNIHEAPRNELWLAIKFLLHTCWDVNLIESPYGPLDEENLYNQ